jgi:CHAT domain-containing protein
MPAAARDQLLAEFHQQVQKGIPPAAALRAAQRRIRADPATSAPINWAGWMLIGR